MPSSAMKIARKSIDVDELHDLVDLARRGVLELLGRLQLGVRVVHQDRFGLLLERRGVGSGHELHEHLRVELVREVQLVGADAEGPVRRRLRSVDERDDFQRCRTARERGIDGAADGPAVLLGHLGIDGDGVGSTQVLDRSGLDR